MPRVDELPMPAQNQIRAARGELPDHAQHAEKKRMTLLQRLANVGLGRREDEEEVDPPAELRPMVRRAPQQQAPAHPEARPLADMRPEAGSNSPSARRARGWTSMAVRWRRARPRMTISTSRRSCAARAKPVAT